MGCDAVEVSRFDRQALLPAYRGTGRKRHTLKINLLCSHPARHFVPGKHRRACPVLTGRPGASLPPQSSKRLNHEEKSESNHHHRGYPGDDIEDRAVCVIHHQLFVVDEKKHKDEYKRKNHPIEDL